MRVFEKLREWITQEQKRKIEDEAMDAAQQKLTDTLETLKASNLQLAESLKGKELHVRQCER